MTQSCPRVKSQVDVKLALPPHWALGNTVFSFGRRKGQGVAAWKASSCARDVLLICRGTPSAPNTHTIGLLSNTRERGTSFLSDDTMEVFLPQQV